MEKLNELKATVFDILRRQAQLQGEIANLDKYKEAKLKEIAAEEKRLADEERNGGADGKTE